MKSFKGKIKKAVLVKLVGDAEKSFHILNKTAGDQKKKGISSSKEITLLNAINNLFNLISDNPFYGENAKKSLIPKSSLKSMILQIFS
jgi:hypothetical protein